MNIRCMIIDDEPPAHKVLENYILKVPFLSLEMKCKNAIEAMTSLSESKIDLIFLDLVMPEMSGYEFLKAIPNPPSVIITTAYSDYALESYEYSVIDYLMKPISFERFMKAINKMLANANKDREEKTATQNFVFFKVDKVIRKVFYDDILFIESCGNYVRINMTGKKMMVYDTLTNIIKILPGEKFVRTHKSFIVAKRHIESISGNMIKLPEVKIPIGRNYRTSVLEKLN